ncbi:MAG: DNA-directed DNA polymerase II small subunit [Candidatus Bathyarchaeia archaeon]|nr:DNA-directed DNA polymerase II small subunit [Candidatus Bathyarchaeota archaeon]
MLEHERNASVRRAISLIIQAGYQVDSGAFEFLKEISEKMDIISLVKKAIDDVNALPEKPLLITREILERKAETSEKKSAITYPVSGKTSFEPYAKNIDPDLKVISDSTSKISATGSLEDCIEYFRSRFMKISRIIRNRIDAKDAGSLADALKAPESSKVKVICMITEKRETKRGIFFKVEDLEDQAIAFAPAENPNVYSKAQKTLLDEVVCLSVLRGKRNFLIIDDIILPDVPLRKPNKSSVPICAALLSDLHVGSKMFMEKEFRYFIRWLRGEVGRDNLREMASRIKYLVIAGDIVDGVGIYPQQLEELEITDLYEQYKRAAEIIEMIPDYIEIVIIPGNHDATRRALPQPAILREYAEPLYELGNIHLLGDPSVISLHGVHLLLSHGRSLDDVISSAPNMSFQAPDEAMKLLLQCRHLAPIYGMRTLIASERTDHLVIEHIPDIFHAGHVHMMKYSVYRGILVVNSGAWQKQTEYQREMGHIPNPGIIPIVDLQTLSVFPIDFTSTI